MLCRGLTAAQPQSLDTSSASPLGALRASVSALAASFFHLTPVSAAAGLAAPPPAFAAVLPVAAAPSGACAALGASLDGSAAACGESPAGSASANVVRRPAQRSPTAISAAELYDFITTQSEQLRLLSIYIGLASLPSQNRGKSHTACVHIVSPRGAAWHHSKHSSHLAMHCTQPCERGRGTQ